jgi:putative transposase
MTLEAAGSHADVQRLCRLAGLPRATYYRHLAGRNDEAGECELRDVIQRICLKHRFYGYRRVTAVLRRQGMVVNAKKVQRLMREDNLLAQRKAPFLKPPADRPSAFLIVPNLVGGLVPSAPDQIWVADITMCISPEPSSILPSFSTPSRAKPSAGLWRTRSMPRSPLPRWT